MRNKEVDRILLGLIIILAIVGIVIFSSASLGLLARDEANISMIAGKQIIIGLVGGFLSLFLVSKIHYSNWYKYAPVIFLLSFTLTLAVFVPGLGLNAGGATRWIVTGPISFQPSEILKFAFVIFLARIFSKQTKSINTWKEDFLPLIAILGVIGVVLLKQPDTGTLMVFFFAGLAMHIAHNCKLTHVLSLIAIGLIGLGLLAYSRPYIKDRILTFMDSSQDQHGSSYQIRQSLLAIGSGGTFGRGFGQSIQKFNFLPEPIGDSIFAVAAEEFGFLGASILVALFLLFGLRGLWVASKTSDSFGRLTAVGIVILIVSQSFINISAMLGLIPLTGVPLLFVSHGGTALLIALIECGVLLNISKYRSQ